VWGTSVTVLESTGYSAWPSPRRLMRRACSRGSADGHTDTQTPSNIIPSPLAERRGEGNVELCRAYIESFHCSHWSLCGFLLVRSGTELLGIKSKRRGFGSAIPKGRQSSLNPNPNCNPSLRVLVGFMGQELLGMAGRHHRDGIRK